MKKLFFTLIAFVIGGLLTQTIAQCTVSNPTIVNARRVPDGTGTCTLKFDLSFSMQNNNGNKTIVIHLWPAASYPHLCYTGGGSCGQPSAAQLAGSYGSIVINNNGSASYFSSYPFTSGVNILATDPVIVRTGGTSGAAYNFSLTGITIPGVPCSGGIIIEGDIWSTNSGSLNSGTNPQCATSGIYLGIGDPAVNGFKDCNNPRLLHFGISTISVTPITVTYKIYRSDGNATFDPTTDINVTLAGSDTVTVSASTSPQGRVVGFTGNGSLGEQSDYWVVVTYSPPSGSPYSIAALFPNGNCVSLPVQLVSFNARRQSSVVILTWETASEQMNKGFEVQRITGTEAQWQTIAFVPTKAINGNSQTALKYTFNDNNDQKAVSRYRIRQIDMDGKSIYSEVVSVKGEGQSSGNLVFPNPSRDGRMNVVFGDAGMLRDIKLTDMAGRVLKCWTGYQNNDLVIENLSPAIYNLIIVVKSTGERSNEKIVVIGR
jgi:hypothetical protein